MARHLLNMVIPWVINESVLEQFEASVRDTVAVMNVEPLGESLESTDENLAFLRRPAEAGSDAQNLENASI